MSEAKPCIRGNIVGRVYLENSAEDFERFLRREYDAKWVDHDQIDFETNNARVMFLLRHATSADLASATEAP